MGGEGLGLQLRCQKCVLQRVYTTILLSRLQASDGSRLDRLRVHGAVVRGHSKAGRPCVDASYRRQIVTFMARRCLEAHALSKYGFLSIYLYILTYIHTHTYRQTYLHTCMHAYIHTYIHDVHICIYTYTYTNTDPESSLLDFLRISKLNDPPPPPDSPLPTRQSVYEGPYTKPSQYLQETLKEPRSRTHKALIFHVACSRAGERFGSCWILVYGFAFMCIAFECAAALNP